jgi:hypothetical protein
VHDADVKDLDGVIDVDHRPDGSPLVGQRIGTLGGRTS